MPPPQRRSLSDRNRAAIALTPEPPAPVAPVAAKPRPSTSYPEPATRTRTVDPKAAATGETARLGVYLTPSEFDDAKAGYLADWINGGQHDTFTRWITAAIDTYASMRPNQRAGAAPRGRSDERTGSTRSFSIPTDTVARMRTAITADQNAGRWPSDSAWCAEAIAHAVNAARTKNGGTLPTPPPRLPNRLAR